MFSLLETNLWCQVWYGSSLSIQHIDQRKEDLHTNLEGGRFHKFRTPNRVSTIIKLTLVCLMSKFSIFLAK